MNFEHDEECTADVGPFGWESCKCSGCNPVPHKMSEKELADRERIRAQQEHETRVSSGFNRYMIDLFNSSQRKGGRC